MYDNIDNNNNNCTEKIWVIALDIITVIFFTLEIFIYYLAHIRPYGTWYLVLDSFVCIFSIFLLVISYTLCNIFRIKSLMTSLRFIARSFRAFIDLRRLYVTRKHRLNVQQTLVTFSTPSTLRVSM